VADPNQLLQQAVADHQAGRLEAAETGYRKILAAEPRHVDALQLLGVLVQQAGRAAEAVTLIEKAVALAPSHAVLHFNLGNAQRAAGDAAGSAGSYSRALEIEPDNPETLNNLASALETIGQAAAAETHCRRALALNPGYALAHNNLGNVLKQQGRMAEALESYAKAAELRPGLAEAHHNAGLAALALGQGAKAFECLRRAVQLLPGDARFWLGWARSLGALEQAPVDAELIGDLGRLLEQPGVNPLYISGPVMAALRRWPAFADADDPAADPVAAMAALAQIPAFMRLIASGPVADGQAEDLLTRLRAAALDAPDAAPLDFLCALALHCFANEYVFEETEVETAKADALADALAGKSGLSPAELAVLACYRPLHRVAGIDAPAAQAWPEPLAAVIRRQIVEPRAEAAIGKSLDRLTPVSDAVSQAVRAQYEENPYPRWVAAPVQGAAAPLARVVRGLGIDAAGFGSKDLDGVTSPEILIAGCGTGHQAIQAATRFQGAQVLAVDFSRASLAYAKRKTDEIGLANIRYAAADILHLGDELGGEKVLDRRFDLIESIGVLHHLGNPVAGLKVLAGLLKPKGLMTVALYSERARRNVVALRALIAEKGWPATAAGIRACRAHLRAIADTDAAAVAILRVPDFYSLSECRDLLFHVQEHRFTTAGIADALAAAELEFLGFEFADGDAMARFEALNPDPAAKRDLAAWRAFEDANPDTFFGMYVFWARRRE